MKKKLRWKFTGIAMIAVTIILSLIMTFINVGNLLQVNSYADTLIETLSDNNGTFNNFVSGENKPFMNPNLNEETPYETRFFIVTVYEDNTAHVDISHTVTVNGEEAVTLANEALSKSSKGTIDEYRYAVVDKDDNSKMVIFVNISKQLQAATNLLCISIIISFLGLSGVFLLVYLLSGRVVKPIVESYEKQKMFIANASHEIKTPLTIISANNEIIEMEYGEDSSTKSINKQVTRLTNMVKNMSTLAHVEEVDVKKDFSKFDLSETLKEVLDSYKENVFDKDKEISDSIADNITISGNEKLIRQLFYVLFDNAEKYSLSKIDVQAIKNNDKVSIIVSNDAANLEEGNLDKCFERFYRSAEARGSNIEGSGIGLSIAKEIVDLHKGSIHATGEQSTFIIEIMLKCN